MKPTKIFIIITFLVIFASQVSAQNDSIPASIDFAELFETRPKKVEGLKIGDHSRNELDDYRFIASGKLGKLKLGISTKKDVVDSFGRDCTSGCAYDADWQIFFTYFNDIGKSVTENKQTTTYIPDPKFIDRIYSIKLIPQKKISLKNIVFPDVFHKLKNKAFGHDFDGHATHAVVDSFTDSYGLKYIIFDKLTFTNSKKDDDRKNGDLISIEYEIPKQIEEKLYIEQK